MQQNLCHLFVFSIQTPISCRRCCLVQGPTRTQILFRKAFPVRLGFLFFQFTNFKSQAARARWSGDVGCWEGQLLKQLDSAAVDVPLPIILHATRHLLPPHGKTRAVRALPIPCHRCHAIGSSAACREAHHLQFFYTDIITKNRY